MDHNLLDHHREHRPGRVDERIRCVLFDLDGTLIDTTELIYRSYQHAFRSVLATPMDREELYVGHGQPLAEAFAAILARRRVELPDAELSALIDRLIRTYREFNLANHDLLAREFPGVRQVLDELRRGGVALGLVTSKSRAIAQRGLDLIGIAEYFRTAVFMEDTTRHKPDPDPLWLALDRLGWRDHPRQALYVGDSTHDLRAGRAAGVQTAAALWGPFPRESLAALEPDYLLSSIVAVLELVRDA